MICCSLWCSQNVRLYRHIYSQIRLLWETKIFTWLSTAGLETQWSLKDENIKYQTFRLLGSLRGSWLPSLSPPGRLPLGIPIKIAIIEKQLPLFPVREFPPSPASFLFPSSGLPVSLRLRHKKEEPASCINNATLNVKLEGYRLELKLKLWIEKEPDLTDFNILFEKS